MAQHHDCYEQEEETGVDPHPLPGFRFYPTEEELLNFYLRQHKSHSHVIGFLNIYLHDPWELPGLAKIGEREWYFSVPRDIKTGGRRRNRSTKNGFWKATGSERKIMSLSKPEKTIGLKKTLVFYTGRASQACKTNWVMNEYRLPNYNHVHQPLDSASEAPAPKGQEEEEEEVVLCKIYLKATRAAANIIIQESEQQERRNQRPSAVSICNQQEAAPPPMDIVSSSSASVDCAISLKREFDREEDPQQLLSNKKCKQPSPSPNPKLLPQIEVPKRESNIWTMRQLEMEMKDYWSSSDILFIDDHQHPFWTPLHTPSPCTLLHNNTTTTTFTFLLSPLPFYHSLA